MKRIVGLLLAALLAGCASPYIDRTYSAVSQDSRAQFLIIHYTAINYAKSLRVLTEEGVSSHYLVSDGAGDAPGNERPLIYQLVDDSRRAYHAGVSYWKGNAQLNPASIGIEIVNLGYRDTPQGRVYFDYPEKQIDLLIRLIKKIVREHQIKPAHILGHSDIAPQRKSDPGPRFPWKRLADEGIIPWFDEAEVTRQTAVYENQLPSVEWFQKKLEAHGFAVPLNGELDPATRSVIAAFQMKYRPSRFDGTPDAQTAAILDAMTSGKTVLKLVAARDVVHPQN